MISLDPMIEQENQNLNVLMEHLPSGVALTADWFNPDQSDSEHESDADKEGNEPLSARSHTPSSMSGSSRFAYLAERPSAPKKALTSASDVGVLKSNDKIYKLLGQTDLVINDTSSNTSQRMQPQSSRCFVIRCLWPMID